MGHRAVILAAASCLVLSVAQPRPTLAQTAGEGSGSESVGGGAMIKSPEHAEKGGDTDRDPKRSDKPEHRSDESISAGSPSPSTAPK